MKVSTDKRTIIVGIFIFVGIGFLVAGILAIGKLNKSFIKKIEVTTVFDDVSGLQQGNNIWFSGVKIGTVKDLGFYGNSQVQVIMNIEEKAQPYIHKDAKAKISTDGIIGNKIIIIYGGTPGAPVIENGDQLSIEKTLSTEDMMKTLQENNVNILAITTDFKDIGKKIMSGEGTLGKLLNDESLYNDLQNTAASLRLAAENTKQISLQLASYSSKLNQEGVLANDLVTDTVIFASLRSTAARLTELTATANEIATNLKNASADPNSPIGVLMHDNESGSSLKTTIKNLEISSQKLNEDLEALQHSFLLRGYFKDQEKK